MSDFDNTTIVLYLLVSISFLLNRLKDFSCSTQRMIQNNILVRHLFNIIAIFFMVVLFTRNNPIHPKMVLLMTIGMYIMFIFITRCDFRFIVIYLILVTVVFYLEAQKSYARKKNDQDPNIQCITRTQMILKSVAFGIVLIGCIIYIGQKSRHHEKGSWSWVRFFLGSEVCSDVPQRVSKDVLSDFVEGLRRVFHVGISKH